MDSTERHTVVTRENVAHPNINRVLHHKCAVIEVIREQMRNIRDWRVERRDVLQRYPFKNIFFSRVDCFSCCSLIQHFVLS